MLRSSSSHWNTFILVLITSLQHVHTSYSSLFKQIESDSGLIKQNNQLTERLLVCGLEQSGLGDKRKQNSSRNFNNRNSFCHFTAVLLSSNDLIFALFHTTFQVSEIKKKKEEAKGDEENIWLYYESWTIQFYKQRSIRMVNYEVMATRGLPMYSGTDELFSQPGAFYLGYPDACVFYLLHWPHTHTSPHLSSHFIQLRKNCHHYTSSHYSFPWERIQSYLYLELMI